MRVGRVPKRGGSVATRFVAIVALGVLAGSCATPGRAPEAPWVRGAGGEPALPAIPATTGSLELDLVYPPPEATLAVRDSTFVFGATGTGQATLWINSERVRVEPNGAFLAFLPVPPDGRYHLTAIAGADTAVLEREVGIPDPPPLLDPGSATIVEGSAFPRGARTALPGEPILVGFQGTPGGRARLVLPNGRAVPLVEERSTVAEAGGPLEFSIDEPRATAPVEPGVARYRGVFAARPLLSGDTSLARPTLVDHGGGERLRRGVAPRRIERGAREGREVRGAREAGEAGAWARRARWRAEGATAWFELVVGTDTARTPLPLNLALLDPARPRVGVAVDAEPVGVSGDETVVGRVAPGYTYHYFWPNGTLLTLTGEREGAYRVRLSPTQSAWVSSREVRLLEPGTPPATGRVGTVRMTPTPDAVDIRISLSEQVPFSVDVDGRTVELTIHGGYGDTDWLIFGPEDAFVRSAAWGQVGEGYRLTVHLNRQPWGYRAAWAKNGDLILSLRRPPAIDARRPLRGLRIAVDAGHPPAGATGPTRLTEAEANLAISERLEALLREAGAEVVMTRRDTAAVPLLTRTFVAETTDAHILVSVHNNAFPDGVDPFRNAGTSVYYFQPFSLDLARAFQRELVAELRLRDLGVGRADLALVRPTWMPSALTETMYMMIPRQEAALRDPRVIDRIARAHVRALETFLRERAAELR